MKSQDCEWVTDCEWVNVAQTSKSHQRFIYPKYCIIFVGEKCWLCAAVQCSCWACSCLWQNSTMNISFFGAVRVVSSDSNIRLVRITWQFTLARLTRKSQSQVSTSSYVAHYESLSSRIFHAQNSRLELNFRRRIKIECPRKPPERQQKKKNGNSVQNS